MVASTPKEAAQAARATTTCVPGYCLKYTRTWLGIDPQQPDAKSAWATATQRHPGDTHPPKGAPVFWAGGQHGHIALSLGIPKGRSITMIRSTDRTHSGAVSSVPLTDIAAAWGFVYLGWSETLNGVAIPYLNSQPWASGDVYVEKLVRGQKDSDSVSRLRYRLQNHPRIPASVDPGLGNDWGPKVTTAVTYLQNEVMPQVLGPKDGSLISNQQANTLFTSAYNVIRK